MVRMARLYLPNTAQLILVRGINQSAVFFAEPDYEQWQSIMRSIAPNHGIAIHAYALIENAVYILATAEHDLAIGKFMQDLGRRHVRYINQAYNRSGTLWEGRYRTAFLQDNRVLDAYIWLDNMSNHSSRQHHEGLLTVGFIADHEQYWTLGNTPFDRQHQYRQRLQQSIGVKISTELAQAVSTGWALGDKPFLTHAARVSGRRVTPATRGRPKKKV